MASRQPFRFLDLLPELRCLIYEMILVQAEPVRIWARGNSEQKLPLVQPILQTNRQIREEAAPFWYGHNIFVTTCASQTLESPWIESIGQANRNLLREFRFEVMDWRILQPSWTFLTTSTARIYIAKFASAMEEQDMRIDPSILWVPVSPQLNFEGCKWVSSSDTKPALEKQESDGASIEGVFE